MPAHDGGVAAAEQRNGGALLDVCSDRAGADQLGSVLREVRQRRLRRADERGRQQGRYGPRHLSRSRAPANDDTDIGVRAARRR